MSAAAASSATLPPARRSSEHSAGQRLVDCGDLRAVTGAVDEHHGEVVGEGDHGAGSGVPASTTA